jgi:hypothetical protein
LTSSGFKELRENEQWNIEPLGKVRRRDEMKIIFMLNLFSILLLKMIHVLLHLLWVESIQMEMVLL